jgi:hypothetical protein
MAGDFFDQLSDSQLLKMDSVPRRRVPRTLVLRVRFPFGTQIFFPVFCWLPYGN